MTRPLARGLGLAVGVAAIAAVLVVLSPNGNLGFVLSAFWRGSFGTWSALVSGTLVRAIPLAIIGAGLSIAFRAGVFNIGGEGQLLLGAVAAAAVGLEFSWLGGAGSIVALIASAVAGAAWAGIAAVLRRRFGVLEVISTILLNFVAANLVSYLVRGPLQEPTGAYPQTDLINAPARLIRIGSSRLHLGVFVAVAVCGVAWWFLNRTAAGFRVRAVGASPSAAAATGRVDVAGVAAGALMASGALAGLAGGIEVTGVTYALYENLSPGYGFSAIAVAILARNNPLGVLPTALLFAALETGALGMQRDAGVPSVVATAIEAVVILAALSVGAGAQWSGRRSASVVAS
jgi:simple sugar transport system permease protein